MADYSVEESTTSSNCLDFATEALVEDDAVRLVPSASPDHYVWAWTARFDSLEGVNSYLASWGDGCEFRTPDSSFTVRLVPPTWLDGETLGCVTLEETDEGRVFVRSVGTLAFTGRWVAEAQLVLFETEGSVEVIEIVGTSPYDSARVRELAEALAGPVTSVLSGF